MPRSPGEQALRRQGVTAVWIAAFPVPHWQAWSVRAQPATEIAEVRQGIAQLGSAPKFCPDTRAAAASTTVEMVTFILSSFPIQFLKRVLRLMW